MVCPYKSRNSCENNVLHTIFTITAFKAFFKATYSEKPQTNAIFMGKLVPNN